MNNTTTRVAFMASTENNLLAQLPEELLQETLTFLQNKDLLALACSSKWAYDKALPLLWHHVELVDCRTIHPFEIPYDISKTDDHDDSPIIRKLLVIANNPWIASQVHVLTHRCHLPSPSLYTELPQTNFQSRFLSHDPRTLRLLELACANLSHLHTLRIIFGHWNITKGLLNGILNKSRARVKPLRKLWLENCALTGLSAHMLRDPDLQSLESLRIRRMQLLQDPGGRTHAQQVYARGFSTQELEDGQGLLYTTTTDSWALQEAAFHSAVKSWETSSFQRAFDDWKDMFEGAHIWDDIIYDHVIQRYNGISDIYRYRNDLWDHQDRVKYHIQKMYDIHEDDLPAVLAETKTGSLPAALAIFEAASSLTSLNLDWIIIRQSTDNVFGYRNQQVAAAFNDIFRLRFPHLRAFQLRNAVVDECQLPKGLYLLDECSMEHPGIEIPNDLCLSFMESHPNICCLAFPMDRFFDSSKPHRSARVEEIIRNLSVNLVDLRVDAMYNIRGELQTDTSNNNETDRKTRKDRRVFISEFAARMLRVEQLKLEGGIPRDERRETIRAFAACPLRKIVLIGVNCPVGNSWGLEGQDIESLGLSEDFDIDDLETLEYEDISAITQLGAATPVAPPCAEKFRAEYGWPPSAPLIHTLAAYHADTITELKFCGYRGAPLLWEQTPITFPMYSALRHFHKLKTLVLSFWSQTWFEDDSRDEEVIEYWLNTRSADSKALVVVPESGTTQPMSWVEEHFAPERIAKRMVEVIGPMLSERAKGRRGGVHVRGSFCIGIFGGTYDFDVQVGKAADGSDVLLEWTGPREDLHPDRRREKEARRRWF